ncbi:hypothetical protein ACI65C_002718 [Semiaphis heraclei]
MNDSCTFTSMDATSLVEFVGKTVVVSTKQQHTSKGVVHTVDPVTKSIILLTNKQCEIFSGINIKSVQLADLFITIY